MPPEPCPRPAVPPRPLAASTATTNGDADAVGDLPQLYIEALEAQRVRDGLLVVAAHELRHPLHIMRMALQRYLPHDEAGREALARYVGRMERLVDDLIDFIRTEQDALELTRETIDVRRLLADLMEDFRGIFDQRKVRLSVKAPTDVRIDGDVHRLIQVFSNLLDNALKFTPAGGAVTMEARVNAGEVTIIVRDTGRGVAPEALARVLDMPTNLSSRHGLSIGLAVARRIVELHDGTITVHSDGVGRGTEATVTLPLLGSQSRA